MGRWIRGFLHSIGFTTSLAAELWHLRDGLKLARSLHICKLIIEIDAKVVVDLIYVENVAAQDAQPYSALVFDCRCLMYSLRRLTSVMYTANVILAQIFCPKRETFLQMYFQNLFLPFLLL